MGDECRDRDEERLGCREKRRSRLHDGGRCGALGRPTTLCTLEELRSARAALQGYEDVLRTPLLPRWPVGGARISLKLESLQTTG